MFRCYFFDEQQNTEHPFLPSLVNGRLTDAAADDRPNHSSMGKAEDRLSSGREKDDDAFDLATQRFYAQRARPPPPPSTSSSSSSSTSPLSPPVFLSRHQRQALSSAQIEAPSPPLPSSFSLSTSSSLSYTSSNRFSSSASLVPTEAGARSELFEKTTHEREVTSSKSASSTQPPHKTGSHFKPGDVGFSQLPRSDKEADLRAREIALIKSAHLGVRKTNQSSMITTGSDTSRGNNNARGAQGSRNRFVFEWNANDDTSRDSHALLLERELNLASTPPTTNKLSQECSRGQNCDSHRQSVISSIFGVKDMDIDNSLTHKYSAREKVSHQDQLVSPALLSSQQMNQKILSECTLSHDVRDISARVLNQSKHWKEKSLQEMTERDWRIFKEDYEIAIRGGRNVPMPLRSWEESGLPRTVLRVIEAASYKEPSPIQRAAIPIGLQKRDIIGIAETGSGKTAAFLIPLLVSLLQLSRVDVQTVEMGPHALVMAPTRELAQQISAECDKFARDLSIRNACIVGGATIETQAHSLRQGVEIVIGTPGRLLDCIEKHFLVLDQCLYVVLDEADRMIDMNFEPQINAVMAYMPATNLKPMDIGSVIHAESSEMKSAANIMDCTYEQVKLPRYRQTVMFTATMPPKVLSLANKFLRSPVEIAVGDRRGKANSNVDLEAVWCRSDNDKRMAMQEIVHNEEPPMIVFCNFKKTCDQVLKLLQDMGSRCASIHGSKSQEMREEALAAFKRGAVDVLVATDVLGRGIDINGVRHVINYEMPPEMDKFTHRIGRTGRAGNKGRATSLLSEEDSAIIPDLVSIMQTAGHPVPSAVLTAMHDVSKRKGHDGRHVKRLRTEELD